MVERARGDVLLTHFKFVAVIGWGVLWGVFGLPWDASTEGNGRGVLWTVIPGTKRQVADAILNFAFYVPLGLLLRSLHVRVLATLAVGPLLSATTEILQLTSATRVPNLADVVFNSAGVAAGILLFRRVCRAG